MEQAGIKRATDLCPAQGRASHPFHTREAASQSAKRCGGEGKPDTQAGKRNRESPRITLTLEPLIGFTFPGEFEETKVHIELVTRPALRGDAAVTLIFTLN